MYRTRDWRRYMRNKHIARKKRISRHWGFDWYSVDGKYSKGKIHCGCGLCKFGKRFGLPSFKTSVELIKFNDDIISARKEGL